MDSTGIKRKSLSLKQLVLIFVGAAVIIMLFFVGSVKASVSDTALIIDGVFREEEIQLSDITELKLLDDSFNRGSKQSGIETFKYDGGTYYTVTLGEYTLIAYKKVDSCIYIRTNDGITVFNLKSNEATAEFYQALEEKLKIG